MEQSLEVEGQMLWVGHWEGEAWMRWCQEEAALVVEEEPVSQEVAQTCLGGHWV